MTTTGFELDQEQIRDLVFREQSQRDMTRQRVVDVNTLWQPPKFVTSWRCRFPGMKGEGPCRVEIDVDADTVERLAMFNVELVRRGDAPIETHEVMVCDAHRRLFDAWFADKVPQRQTQMRDAIQKLKKSDRPREEHALIESIAKRHPDIDGLILALEEKLGGKNKRRDL